MWQWLKNLFKTEPIVNDWRVVWVETGQWTYQKVPTYQVTYTIGYSRRLNKFKLEMGGHDPKNHPMYEVALKKLVEYDSRLLASELGLNNK